MDQDKALKLLGQYRDQLTKQQILALCGQIKAGDVDAAVKGLTRIVMGGAKG